jgi:alcohol dehydrogenase
MRALVVHRFGEPPVVDDVPDPRCPRDGVVVRVAATGLCRSDWHAWRGHDAGVVLPHVPGHELAGVIVEAGPGVRRHAPGDRVTVPFVCACGECEQCRAGDDQVCVQQEQPGFTRWGSFAELVALPRADHNLVAVPGEVTFDAAALLGCRFTTAYRAVVLQGGLQAGQWLAVHGCGGVGLAAVMIGAARGAHVVAVDVAAEALALAAELGAAALVAATPDADVGGEVRRHTGGGAHVSVDAVGSAQTWAASTASLRRRGRHVQVGLPAPTAARQPVDVAAMVAHELAVVGSHGMAARDFAPVLGEIADGRLDPQRLVRRVIDLDELPSALVALDDGSPVGVTVCHPNRGLG